MCESFESFLQEKENEELQQRINDICEVASTFDKIALSNHLREANAMILSGRYHSEETLVEGIFDIFNRGKSNMGRGGTSNMSFLNQRYGASPNDMSFLNRQADANPSSATSSSTPSNDMSFLNRQAGGNPSSDAPSSTSNALSADAQSKVQASIQTLKQELSRSMHSALERFKQNRDSIGYQVAQNFMNKIGPMIDQAAGNLKFVRGNNKFDKNAAFGASNNVGSGVDVGDRWKQIMATPEGKQKVAATYGQKLGVDPSIITRLIDGGFTNPSLWPGMIAQSRQGQSAQA